MHSEAGHTSAIRVPSGPDRTGPTAAIVRSSFPKIRHNRSPDKTYIRKPDAHDVAKKP